MNVAYLDPAYSRYFHELAACIAARTGGRSLALLSSPAYRQYTMGDKSMVWTPGRSAQSRQLPPEFEKAQWAPKGDMRAAAVLSHAVEWFIERFRQERIELALIFSDARPFSVAARLAAQEAGVVCLYFERGAFRLATSSLSTQGLNARFSVERAKARGGISGLPADAPLQPRPSEPWLRLRFARFVLHNLLARARNGERRFIQHKYYDPIRYARLAWVQWRARHHHRRADPGEHAALRGKRLVIVALQLPSDSQLVLYSPFETNQQFIDFVAAGVRAVAPDAMLLLKRHPMDASHDHLPNGARWVEGNLARFDGARPVVVCINSTVGFESLVRGLRVICFAPSFYSDAPALVQATRASFSACLRQLLDRDGDAEAGPLLRADMLRWYQAPGDSYAYTHEDIEATAGIVLEHLGAARAGVRAGQLAHNCAGAAETIEPCLPAAGKL
jgi:capsular polysaccharide export protein